MGRQPRVRHQSFEFGKKFSAHADIIHALAYGSIHETTYMKILLRRRREVGLLGTVK